MSTYKQIQDQIRQLQQQAEVLRKKELGNAISQVRAIMAEYGLTISDLGIIGKKKGGRARVPLAPKYRNPSTGETWSGRGKAPKWLDTKNKEKYLIK
ncbi:MAG: H-NS histone family protein [Burkholderiaceae bacterium]|jgi:DNA-binding protein H-NS|nr:H-NS histone family protein [Burkholderiaceae bacterium]